MPSLHEDIPPVLVSLEGPGLSGPDLASTFVPQSSRQPGRAAEGSPRTPSLKDPASARSILPGSRSLGTAQLHQGSGWRRSAHPGRGEGKPFPILLFADLPVTQPGDLVNVQRKISLLFNILHNVHPIQLVNRIMTGRRWKCGDNSICAPDFQIKKVMLSKGKELPPCECWGVSTQVRGPPRVVVSIPCTLTERRCVLGPPHSLSGAEAGESERMQPARGG